MKANYFSRMNPMLRGFLIIALIALAVVLLRLQTTLAALLFIARIVFVLAIAFFIYLMWREAAGGDRTRGRRAPASSSTAPLPSRRGSRRQLVRRRTRPAGARLRRRARRLWVRDVAHVARPSHLV